LIETENDNHTATDEEYQKMKYIHLFAFVEIYPKQDEQYRSKNYHKLKQ